jgi:Fur family ferric uptake transcriptional regulator
MGQGAKMKRKTNQRNAIQEVFLRTDRPLGIDEILETARRTVGSLNQATVYRNLKLLVQKGWLKKVHTYDLGILYEIAGKEHHHHFQCRVCDRLYEISGCAFNERSATPPGFVTEGHEVYLFGLCAGCNE